MQVGCQIIAHLRPLVGLCEFLQLSAEGLVQQRPFQLIERGEFALVDGLETLGFLPK